MEKCKCVDCGLLAMRRMSDTGLSEVPLYVRQKNLSVRSDLASRFQVVHEITPICIARKFEFSPKEEVYFEQFREDRNCDGFSEWTQGFTPREHVEAMQELMREQRENAREWRIAMMSAAFGIIGAFVGAHIADRNKPQEQRPVIIQVAPELSVKKSE